MIIQLQKKYMASVTILVLYLVPGLYLLYRYYLVAFFFATLLFLLLCYFHYFAQFAVIMAGL